MTTNRLAELEKIIAKDRFSFYQIGKALRQIRDDGLFRDLLFDSFEAYVKDRWDMARSQAYRLIEASKVIDNLSPIGNGILPENESQARVLTYFKKHDQRKIWHEFVSSGMTLNAVNIGKFACNRIEPVKKPKNSSLTDVISVSFKAAVTTMMEQIRLAKNDDWKTTSKQAALFWLKVMKENITFNWGDENKNG